MISHKQHQRLFSRERSAFLVILISLAACAPEKATGERVAVGDKTKVLIGPGTICMPPGAWLLVRNQEAVCAVRVVEAWAVGEATHAQIEVAVRDSDTWKRDSVAVVEYPLTGPHPISFQRGNVTIPCGAFKAKYSRPTCIGLPASSGAGEADRMMAAPTAWSNLGSIELNEQRLKWYTIDDNSEEEIDLVTLPGHSPGESQ